ncbi:MAG: S9 family peptidase [Acidobacteria bacterium]|nr:S9 family peptidase [Acidobacteriota bacterium]
MTTPPKARRGPLRLERHGHVRIDDYAWLNRRDDPEVLAYLREENAYREESMRHTLALQERLYEEIVGRISPDDETVPYLEHGYWYHSRFRTGQEYPLWFRRGDAPGAPEELMLDVNAVAAGHEFCSLIGAGVTRDGRVLAWAEDFQGRRIYTLRFKDLARGVVLADVIPQVTGNAVWASDGRTLFYTRQDPLTLRAHRVFRHVLGTDPADDPLVYQEDDETFDCRVGLTRDEKFVLLASCQTLSREYRYIPADQPTADWQLFQPREREHEYDIDHLRESWYIRTNWQARNFRLMACGAGPTLKEAWTEVLPHRPETLLEGFELFREHLVVLERAEGLTQVRVRRWDGTGEQRIDFGEPVYLVFPEHNPTPDTRVLRYEYQSLTTPRSVYDYDMDARRATLLREEPVLGGFDRANYRTERLWATARDGTRVPISLVYREGWRRDGTAPLLLYGYGSYGISSEPAFSSPRLSLLDRGWAFAIAHVRGGEELGRAWYEDGKLLKKRNTFTDFIDCGRFLVAGGYCAGNLLFAMGGSAGGLLIGAVANMAPELWRGLVAHVPFVDCVTTMLDDELPLTTGEYDEWGNPHDPEFHRLMLSYSPYDNVEAKAYPALLVTTALHDSQVQYFEPAKWVAKLRALKTDDNPLYLYTNMEAGHGGATGRFKRHRETALDFAFLLDVAARAT